MRSDWVRKIIIVNFDACVIDINENIWITKVRYATISFNDIRIQGY
ncbi:hypothetical protein [Limosilactobacillus reuteri]|nr:hypothetical protein [Limosilactobacillus reuteri]